jgi:hypothetical protein|tara:strand:- start:997 stop:1257 length:261 start_codon:yes stop_codon:yes gene_type:complete
MSLSKIVLVSVLSLLIFALPEVQTAATPKASASASKAEKSGDGEKKEKGEGKSKNKMSLEGGLYTTDKVSVVKSNKGNRPVSIRTE